MRSQWYGCAGRRARAQFAAVCGMEEGGVLHSGVYLIRIGKRWLNVPYTLELPRMRRAVVPLMGAGNAVVGEFVADRRPCLAAVLGALHDLAKPAGGLRGVDAVWVGGRAFEVVDLPSGKVWAGNLPLLARGVGGKDEGTLACAHKKANPRTVRGHKILRKLRGPEIAYRKSAMEDGTGGPAGFILRPTIFSVHAGATPVSSAEQRMVHVTPAAAEEAIVQCA